MWSSVAEIGLAHVMAGRPGFRDEVVAKYVAMAERGATASGTDLWAILDTVAAVRRQTSRLFAQWDAVLMPACAAMPWAADVPFPAEIDGQPVGPRGHAIYTGWVNAAGHPAISIPAPVEGMPIGAQIVADLGGEGLLLDLADAYGAKTPLFPRWPAMAETA